MKTPTDALDILSPLEDLHYLSRTRGIYDRVAKMMQDRVDAGEPVSGEWITETVKALQIEEGLVDLVSP